MAAFTKFGAFLKNAWAKEPVITASAAIGLMAVIIPVVSPYTRLTGELNKATPYNYPVPVRDDGNMPDVPSHPIEKLGPNIDWFKNM
ncbi:NADH dehydrogenase [ubiquinone] 1 alpha subcomplex subunit 3 [Pelobates fuscus]|uniref:NADH dehydrogenase [ubiquinone] 1 alpha subcomplex subunit 3 n=1 Tax=Pelobates fuscus TaxID=191477 RepID=UPI002FE45C38